MEKQISCFPVMGVIPEDSKVDALIDVVVSPLWGLFLILEMPYIPNASCFPVMGVIQINQLYRRYF